MGSQFSSSHHQEWSGKTNETNETITMSYYRYMTGVYRSYWPHLNRSLRSCSAPRHVPEPVPSRISRAASTPFYSSTYTTPVYERAVSVPRQLTYSYDTRCIVTPPPATQYSDFDYKVVDYMGRLDREDTIRNNINTTRVSKYYGKKPNYIGDVSSSASCDFRHYNYRRVPYFGGSDDYQFIRRKEYRGGRCF